MAINKDTGLTDKQEKFCQEYLIDLNGTQAAIRAGYSKNTANEQATRLLANVSIQTYLNEIRKPLQEKTGLTQEWVLNRFKEISDRCVQAVPVMRFDPVNKVMVQATELNEETGEEIGLWSFDSNGANKATEMIGKHLGFFQKDNDQSKPVINNVLPQNDIKTLISEINKANKDGVS